MAEWARDYSPEQVMATLQSAGVPAGVVETPKDMLEDPQMKHRRYYWYLDHLVIGRHAYQSYAYRLSKTPTELRTAAPILGQHNDYVYKELLGMSDEEHGELEASGVFV